MRITNNYRKLSSLLLLGFASGLPLFLTSRTLQLWMKDAQIDTATITLFVLVGLPYSLKFIWSPLLDRFKPPFLGLRRGWLFLTQLGLMLAILLLSVQQIDPNPQTLQFLAIICLIITFLSATQDIAGDAYRTDILAPQEIEIGASAWVWGYRIATVIAGYLSPILADFLPWKVVYMLMAGLMGMGMLVTLKAPAAKSQQVNRQAPISILDAVIILSIVASIGGLLWWIISDPCMAGNLECSPWQKRSVQFYWILGAILAAWIAVSFLTPLPADNRSENSNPQTLKEAAILPLQEFLHRSGLLKGCIVLAFILLYKLGDSLVGVSANPFLGDIGFSKSEIGGFGLTGFIATSVGILAGGAVMTAIGTNRALWIFGILQLLSNFGYYALAQIGKDNTALLIAINIENFCAGLVAVVTVAYMMSLCSHNFTTTQYALFSSLMAIGRDVLAAPAGELVKATGWSNFFIISVFAALPGLFLLPLVAPWNTKTPPIARPGLD